MFSKSSTVTILVDKVVVVGSSEHLDKFDDVWVVDFGKDCNFVVGKFTKFRSVFELLHVHDFNCVEVFVFLVFCFIDVTILSMPYFLK